MSTSAPDPQYVLGHSEEELARLSLQARLLNPLTEAVLRRAGIEPGMQVLDVGCGAGDVSLLAARLVAPGGRVVGVDMSAEALNTARTRAAQLGQTNTEFVPADLNAGVPELPEKSFDAVIGRAMLYALKDPAALLRSLRRYLREGGMVVFQEPSFYPTGLAWPRLPLWETVGRWWWETQEKASLDRQLGLKLYGIFVSAGLPAPQLHHDLFIGEQADPLFHEWIASTTRSILPALVALGVATAQEVGIDTLAARLKEETAGRDGVLLGGSLVSAWARVA